MSNAIEKGTQRPTEQEEISESCREIFTTAIEILRVNGQLSARGFFNRRQTTFTFFLHATDSPKQDAAMVKIVAGANLAEARKVSIHAGWRLRLDVRKKVLKGQETYTGKEINEHSGHGEELNGSRQHHIDAVHRFLNGINRVSNEIAHKPH